MSFHRGSSSDTGGDDGPSAWPSSLSTPETEELYRFGLLVPPGCRLPHDWKLDKDGYPTRGPGATAEEEADRRPLQHRRSAQVLGRQGLRRRHRRVPAGGVRRHARPQRRPPPPSCPAPPSRSAGPSGPSTTYTGACRSPRPAGGGTAAGAGRSSGGRRSRRYAGLPRRTAGVDGCSSGCRGGGCCEGGRRAGGSDPGGGGDSAGGPAGGGGGGGESSEEDVIDWDRLARCSDDDDDGGDGAAEFIDLAASDDEE